MPPELQEELLVTIHPPRTPVPAADPEYRPWLAFLLIVGLPVASAVAVFVLGLAR